MLQQGTLWNTCQIHCGTVRWVCCASGSPRHIHNRRQHSIHGRYDERNMEINSMAPGKFEWNFSYVIFKRILEIDGWCISCEIALIWMSLDFTDDQSTLVQVMAWCRQATSHYLSQCWPSSMSSNGVTRPQWVNIFHFICRTVPADGQAPSLAGTGILCRCRTVYNIHRTALYGENIYI